MEDLDSLANIITRRLDQIAKQMIQRMGAGGPFRADADMAAITGGPGALTPEEVAMITRHGGPTMRPMSSVRCYCGGPMILAEQEYAGGTDERCVEERIHRICEDLTAGRVIPKQVDQLEEAVRRTKVDQNVGRAVRR
jgi:hypothetical protein